MQLPPEIQKIFMDTLNGEMSLEEFEQWLYSEKRLEMMLRPEDYLALISYGYKTDTAKKWLYPLFEKHIDKAEFEKKRIRRLLTMTLDRDEKLPQLLVGFYELYCNGYTFLDNLGLGYGLGIKAPEAINVSAKSWAELSNKKQNNLLNSFYPTLEMEIVKVISWLDDGKVILTGIRDETGCWEYVDNRTEEEMRPTGYTRISGNEKKPWWKIW